jgi:hypothetical protein
MTGGPGWPRVRLVHAPSPADRSACMAKPARRIPGAAILPAASDRRHTRAPSDRGARPPWAAGRQPDGLAGPPCPLPSGSASDERPISGSSSIPSGKSATSADFLGLGLTGRGGRAAQKRRSPRRCARSGACQVRGSLPLADRRSPSDRRSSVATAPQSQERGLDSQKSAHRPRIGGPGARTSILFHAQNCQFHGLTKMNPCVNPPESWAHAPHCARESSRITGTCTPLRPRILPNHGHMHPTVPANPPESRAHAPHCARESSRIMDTCTLLCPQILPNHGHMHSTVPTNPPESRAHAPHCARESSRITGKPARTTSASSSSMADLSHDARLPRPFGVPCVLSRPRIPASPPPKPRLGRRIGASGPLSKPVSSPGFRWGCGGQPQVERCP